MWMLLFLVMETSCLKEDLQYTFTSWEIILVPKEMHISMTSSPRMETELGQKFAGMIITKTLLISV